MEVTDDPTSLNGDLSNALPADASQGVLRDKTFVTSAIRCRVNSQSYTTTHIMPILITWDTHAFLVLLSDQFASTQPSPNFHGVQLCCDQQGRGE